MTPSTRNSILLGLNALVWSLNALALNGAIVLKAKPGIPINLETRPARTKLFIDGEITQTSDAYNGWLESPATIRLGVGQHKLLLERPGYAPHTFKVLVNPTNEKLELKSELEALPQANNSVEIHGDDGDLENIFVILDQGLEMGSIPLTANDLLPGVHVVEITTTGLDAFRVKPVICSFSIPASNAPLTEIGITRKGNKLSVQGCRKLRKLP